MISKASETEASNWLPVQKNQADKLGLVRTELLKETHFLACFHKVPEGFMLHIISRRSVNAKISETTDCPGKARVASSFFLCKIN